jgi:DNA polymerase III epsilon subunit-like protein
MEAMLTVADRFDVTFIVLDFETLTPPGRPPEPIEVAAIAGRIGPDGGWRETGRYQALIRPPADVPVTGFDQAQNGLTRQALDRQRPAGPVMAALDARLASPPYRLVAHSAHTEATVIGGQTEHCPTLASTGMLCTVKLSRAAFPELPSHRLDALADYLCVPLPPDRHRAMPDAELTVQVLQRAVAAGDQRGLWPELCHLDAAGAILPRHSKTGPPRASRDQDTLF